ncbi:MAG TPA: Ni/Fe-hydrogenase cytochrome b subunit [Vicinamibacterales bacterium]|nr:Ni/Fe-hydrogenase cytochrome b subunit [Vicinamibacterales bacterium]
MSAHAAAEPVGGRLMTPSMRVLLALFGIGTVIIAWRLVAGLGATTALNDGYPFGLWIAFDVVTGTALACGGYAVAILVYILNKGQYSPLVRPAILTSALGYTLAGIGVALDVGRWWGLWKVPIYFWRWNLNSALLEIALCIMAYVVVLWVEMAPFILETLTDSDHLGLRRVSRRALPILKRASLWIVALGLLLPTMHQSSLGTLMLLANSRLHELWRTPMMPLFFLLTCVSMGYAVVVFESAFSSVAFGRRPDTAMLAGLAAVIGPLQVVVVVLRIADLAMRGVLGALVTGDIRANLAILELALFLAPAAMLISSDRRRDLGHLVRAAMVMMFAGALYRFDVFLVAFNPGAHWSYFPSVPELLVTVGLVAAEVFAYVFIVRNFPILSGGRTAAPERQAA